MVLCGRRRPHLCLATTIPVNSCLPHCNYSLLSHITIYRSEGPAQVFLLVVAWLITTFGHMKREEWGKIVLAYDYMCHVDNLRVAQSPLPLPGRLKHIWHDINKIIDDLHLRNHKDARCAEKYSSSTVRGEIPDMNTMSCEQTFAWLSRFKKILCAMTKTHHHFYLHRFNLS